MPTPITRRWLLLAPFAIALMTSPAAAIDGKEMFDDPALERRAREIGRELRCLVCQNQSIFDSNANLARDLRAVVRERIVAGDTDTEAVRYIAERYGDYVLLKPPVKPITYALWAAPALSLCLAGLAGFVYLRRRRAPSAESTPMSANDRAAARRILEGGEP